MKKLLFIGCLVLISSFSFSQTKSKNDSPKDFENGEERMKVMKDKMAKELNLTEDQIKKINSIDEKYKSREESLRNQSESLRDQKHKLMDEKRSEVDKILTEDQKRKLKDMKSKFHDRKDHKRPQMPPSDQENE